MATAPASTVRPTTANEIELTGNHTRTLTAKSATTKAAASMDRSNTDTKVPTTTSTTVIKQTSVATPPVEPTSTPTSVSTSTATSTAVPEIVVPDEPGELSPTARTDDVDTITVGEDELDVVVVGNEVPTDARGGAAALEIWLGGGNPSSTWETFASDDPDADGWRWAAINQKTGTIVYIV